MSSKIDTERDISCTPSRARKPWWGAPRKPLGGWRNYEVLKSRLLGQGTMAMFGVGLLLAIATRGIYCTSRYTNSIRTLKFLPIEWSQYPVT